MNQPDIFPRKPTPYDHASESRKVCDQWGDRTLRDLSKAEATYCFPGFMGAVCERLVERGLASKAGAGVLEGSDFPQFTYAITEAGRLALSTPSQVDRAA